jgi:cell wall-associated NlpC family hydrolase
MRVAGWQRRLNEFVIATEQRYKAVGFKPGEFDCVHFVADWVQVLTGTDPLGDYRGAYTSIEQGLALIREGGLRQALEARFGAPVEPSKAMRGDVAFCESLQMCGIYFTSGARMCALFLGEGGFTLRRARDTDFAFRVD